MLDQKGFTVLLRHLKRQKMHGFKIQIALLNFLNLTKTLPKDLLKASELYLIAFQNGYSPAESNLERVAKENKFLASNPVVQSLSQTSPSSSTNPINLKTQSERQFLQQLQLLWNLQLYLLQQILQEYWFQRLLH